MRTKLTFALLLKMSIESSADVEKAFAHAYEREKSKNTSYCQCVFLRYKWPGLLEDE